MPGHEAESADPSALFCESVEAAGADSDGLALDDEFLDVLA